jgi:hypothetical protein
MGICHTARQALAGAGEKRFSRHSSGERTPCTRTRSCRTVAEGKP